MTYPKVDKNQGIIVEELRAKGFSVLLLNLVKKGCPDILVSNGEINLLVEIKQDGKKKLTEDEINFHQKWSGPLIIATTTKEIEDFFNVRSKAKEA